MDLGIRVPTGLPIRDVALFIKKCEDAGFTGAGVVDHQHSSRDLPWYIFSEPRLPKFVKILKIIRL